MAEQYEKELKELREEIQTLRAEVESEREVREQLAADAVKLEAKAESAEKRAREAENAPYGKGFLSQKIASLEAALRESACPDFHKQKDFCGRKECDIAQAALAPESAPKEPEDLGEIMGQAAKRVHDTWKEIEKKPKPPAPGASEAPECAHVDTLGRGKCDRCGIWEEEYRLLIEPKAKDSSVQKALDENMKKHDGVMRELEDKELGDLAAKREASAKPEDYVPLEELTAPAPSGDDLLELEKHPATCKFCQRIMEPKCPSCDVR